MSTPPRKQLTLVLILNEHEKKILLGMKKRGFGCGRWNGFGGKKQGNETIEKCAERETFEECGLTMVKYTKVGHMIFEFVGDPVLLDVYVFRCTDYTGDITESEEMRPQWFTYSDVPFEHMWPDDHQWFPYMLKNQKFKAYYLFQGHDKILKEELSLVDAF
ncbi:oxidized purine nucleoside triphosphate hydrolase-like [Hydractinia symbiolongicarpus]|uniref:oxidized purine nucleoside triphosphate hydrolase-like n=1 Tax=Hydractinia symbiolongicarpus TaxID=13093 RepID=UPI0025519DAD|nr:oxidized purine nucleoside triphosphate hydrolase-like [Hydractinia symbiolongicarpus]